MSRGENNVIAWSVIALKRMAVWNLTRLPFTHALTHGGTPPMPFQSVLLI